MLRQTNNFTSYNPFEHLQVADIGDVRANLYNTPVACDEITRQYKEIVGQGCAPLTLGGDHLIAYPILRAIHHHHGKVSQYMVIVTKAPY